jgi:hypothetical protein
MMFFFKEIQMKKQPLGIDIGGGSADLKISPSRQEGSARFQSQLGTASSIAATTNPTGLVCSTS